MGAGDLRLGGAVCRPPWATPAPDPSMHDGPPQPERPARGPGPFQSSGKARRISGESPSNFSSQASRSSLSFFTRAAYVSSS